MQDGFEQWFSFILYENAFTFYYLWISTNQLRFNWWPEMDTLKLTPRNYNEIRLELELELLENHTWRLVIYIVGGTVCAFHPFPFIYFENLFSETKQQFLYSWAFHDKTWSEKNVSNTRKQVHIFHVSGKTYIVSHGICICVL